jgi:hypothetical protein
MGADEVSAALQSVFAAAAQGYQRISAQAETFHSQFVSLLNGGAAAYLNTEIANAQQTGAAAVPAVRVTGGAATTPINIFNLPGLFTFSETFPLTGGAFADITLFGTTIYNGRINDQLAQFFLRL